MQHNIGRWLVKNVLFTPHPTTGTRQRPDARLPNMDVIGWFVPPDALDDPRKNTRHRGITKAMLT
ncbi:MAG: hypothetical protein NDI67_16410, partial [Sulfuritalea sp.]|nr:hypothetical protein [Sulfuritalea sp.]